MQSWNFFFLKEINKTYNLLFGDFHFLSLTPNKTNDYIRKLLYYTFVVHFKRNPYSSTSRKWRISCHFFVCHHRLNSETKPIVFLLKKKSQQESARRVWRSRLSEASQFKSSIMVYLYTDGVFRSLVDCKTNFVVFMRVYTIHIKALNSYEE